MGVQASETEVFKGPGEEDVFGLDRAGIIQAREILVDATLFPEEIKYPTDVGLLNDVRQ